MSSLWQALEERTRTWNALGRQGLADAVWEGYVSVRFARTGDLRALEFIYPYLNHSDRNIRLRAIKVAGRIFEGRGTSAIDSLDYFTKNPDLFLRDRAVQVLGYALKGCDSRIVLNTFRPYLDNTNLFVRKQAVVALGEACAGQGDQAVLQEIVRVSEKGGPSRAETEIAAARVFQGKPTEEVYTFVVKPSLSAQIDTRNEEAIGILISGADKGWYDRAYEEALKPRLHVGEESGWRRTFIQRDGIQALTRAGAKRGMDPLEKMLHLRNERCTEHALINNVSICFLGAAKEANIGPLLDLAQKGDLPAQRIAAIAIGALMMGTEDKVVCEALLGLCEAKSKAVQSAALLGLGMAARSSCDERIGRACLDRFIDPETAWAAVRAFGMLHLGSGSDSAFERLRSAAGKFQERPVRGKKHSRPLAGCYWATGVLYLGMGSTKPMEFLLDMLALPRIRNSEYQAMAATALVMMEFPEAVLGWEYVSSGYKL